MNLEAIADAIKKYAPTIASFVSIANPAAGSVLQLLCHLFNTDPTNTNHLPTAILNDPNAMNKLTSLEHIAKIKTEIDFKDN